MKKLLFLFCFGLLSNWTLAAPEVWKIPYSAVVDLEVTLPEFVLSDVSVDVIILPSMEATDSALLPFNLPIDINGKVTEVEWSGGAITVPATFSSSDREVVIKAGNASVTKAVHPIPLWLSIIPPLLAILMALVFREVLSSLFAGIFVGAAIIGVYTHGPLGILNGLMSVVDTYIIKALNDSGHLSVIVFSMLIGAVVAIISRNGGMQGVVNSISRYAKDARSGQLATWFLGVAIFFDDYANTLIVGNTMRPVTDKLRISREKLSYLVDSTAAPIAAIAFVTTWIGAELGYIESGIAGISEINETESVYSIFLESLKYSFYPIFTLLFMLMLIWKNRDFGPMFKAEKRARTTGQISRQNNASDEAASKEAVEELQMVEGIEAKQMNAILPIAVLIFGSITGLLFTGFESCQSALAEVSIVTTSWAETWNQLHHLPNAPSSFISKIGAVIGSSDSYVALLWASLSSLLVAIFLTIGQRILSLSETMATTLQGFKSMLPAIAILVLAWALAIVTEHLHTADFLTASVQQFLSPAFLPALTFVLAAFVAFSTGSSWGTMAILYPLVLPVSWAVCQQTGFDHPESMVIFYNVVSTVLAGSVLGDHCSPISDTTILSSLASQCNHIDHVRTQLPYALTVGLVATFIGTIPAGFGVPSWILFPAGIGVLYAIIHFFGKEVPANPADS